MDDDRRTTQRVMSHLDANEFCMTMAMACRMWIFATSSFIEAMAAWRRDCRISPKRFGQLEIVGTLVKDFKEKPDGEGGYINAVSSFCPPRLAATRGRSDDMGARTA